MPTSRRSTTSSIITRRSTSRSSLNGHYQPFIHHLKQYDITPSSIKASKKALLETETNWKKYKETTASTKQQKAPNDDATINSNNNNDDDTMSSTNKQFSEQQRLANKKHSELTDNEKIFLLKREIDNLRGQVREQNGGTLNKALTASSGGGSLSPAPGFCRTGTLCHQLPLVSLFLVSALALVAHLRRRRIFEKVGEIVNTGLSLAGTTTRGRRSSRRPHCSDFAELGMVEEFELAEHSSSSSLEPEITIIDNPSPDADAATTTTKGEVSCSDRVGYEAPDATTAQFV